MADEAWQLEDVPVRLQVGGRTLAVPRLPLLVYQESFTRLPPPPAPMPLPRDRLRDGVLGCYVPSRPVLAPLPAVAVEDGLLRLATCFTRRLVAFSGSYEEYTRKWSARSRGNLRRRQRDLARLDPVVRAYRSAADVRDYLAAVDAITRRSYQGALVGAVVDERYRAYTRRQAAEGRLHGFVLFHGERPIAFLQLSARGRELHLMRLGHDLSYRKSAPGMMLMLAVLETLHDEERWELLDFGEGDAEYKAFLSTSGVPSAELYYLRFTPRTLAVAAARESLAAAARAGGALLERAGVKERVKRFLRERSVSAE